MKKSDRTRQRLLEAATAEFTASLADYYAEHPEVLRIASWYELEQIRAV